MRPPRRIETVPGAFGRVHAPQSDAVWIISAGVVAREVADGRLVRLPVDAALTKGPVGLMTRASLPESNAQLLFRQAVMRIVEGFASAVQGRSAKKVVGSRTASLWLSPC